MLSKENKCHYCWAIAHRRVKRLELQINYLLVMIGLTEKEAMADQ